MKKLKAFWDAIPGWLFLILVIGVVAFFIDPIVNRLRVRVANVERAKLRDDAQSICFRKNFDNGRRRQACLDGRRFARIDGLKELEFKFIKELCYLNDFNSCFELTNVNRNYFSKDELRKLLFKACNDGRGGSMEACGQAASYLDGLDDIKAREFRSYACANDFKRFCK